MHKRAARVPVQVPGVQGLERALAPEPELAEQEPGRARVPEQA